MYKTIRHGENSLQYTILPQNDDFRIEGKSAVGSGSGVSSRPANRRPKRRSFFAYLGLIFVCTVIVGAVLIPFLVSAECLPIPTDWLMKTKAALAGGGSSASGDSKDSHRLAAHGEGFNRIAGGPMGHGVSVGKSVKIISRGGVEKIVLKVNKTTPPDTVIAGIPASPQTTLPPTLSKDVHQFVANTDTNHNDINNTHNMAVAVAATESSAVMPGKHFVAEIRFDDAGNGGTDGINPAVVPTILVTTVRNANGNPVSGSANQNDAPLPQEQQPTKVLRPTRPASFVSSAATRGSPLAAPPNRIGYQSSSGGGLLAPPPATPTTMSMGASASRIIQVPLLKSASKKPNIPPVLAKNQPAISMNTSTASRSSSPAAANSQEIAQGGNSDSNIPSSNLPTTRSLTTLGHTAPANGKADWMQAHWPYIDPSTYFQWTGYKAEDSVLLPLLLGFALIGMILVIMVCLVARKRTVVSSVRKRNRNDVEEQGTEDNATLLAATSLSDDD